MIRTVNFKAIVVELIVLLYILLFVYAAVSKLLDFDKFQVQIGQSPLLSAFAGPISVLVPGLELFIVLLLCLSKFRFWGLLASFHLMVLFTMYIFFILHYSSNIPCSCGGILEALDWREHLVFNSIFLFLALFCLVFYSPKPSFFNKRPYYLLLILLLSIIISFISLYVLHYQSERITHQRNTFIRRFDSHAQPEQRKKDLKVNSYYFSGYDNGILYLGNRTAPLMVTKIDTVSLSSEVDRIQLDYSDFTYKSLQVQVLGGDFYVTDGTVPCIYHGSTINWKAELQQGKANQFTLAAPMERDRIAIRITSPSAAANILGFYSISDSLRLKINQTLLERQVDGIFDTDGMLLYNASLDCLVYVYYYRNKYLTISKDLKLLSEGKSIDTVSRAQISVARLSEESTMRTPPLVIHKLAATYQNLLFLYSERIGKYEDRKMLDHAGIVDVYDLNTGAYVSSLYVYHVEGKKMDALMVYGSKLYTLSGSFLTVLPLDASITKNYNINKKLKRRND